MQEELRATPVTASLKYSMRFQSACEPKWRNWQTRQVQDLVPVTGVEVQVLSSALQIRARGYGKSGLLALLCRKVIFTPLAHVSNMVQLPTLLSGVCQMASLGRTSKGAFVATAILFCFHGTAVATTFTVGAAVQPVREAENKARQVICCMRRLKQRSSVVLPEGTRSIVSFSSSTTASHRTPARRSSLRHVRPSPSAT